MSFEREGVTVDLARSSGRPGWSAAAWGDFDGCANTSTGPSDEERDRMVDGLVAWGVRQIAKRERIEARR